MNADNPGQWRDIRDYLLRAEPAAGVERVTADEMRVLRRYRAQRDRSPDEAPTAMATLAFFWGFDDRLIAQWDLSPELMIARLDDGIASAISSFVVGHPVVNVPTFDSTQVDPADCGLCAEYDHWLSFARSLQAGQMVDFLTEEREAHIVGDDVADGKDHRSFVDELDN